MTTTIQSQNDFQTLKQFQEKFQPINKTSNFNEFEDILPFSAQYNFFGTVLYERYKISTAKSISPLFLFLLESIYTADKTNSGIFSIPLDVLANHLSVSIASIKRYISTFKKYNWIETTVKQTKDTYITLCHFKINSNQVLYDCGYYFATLKK